MKTVEMADAVSPLTEYAAKARTETVVVTRRGKPVAAVVPIEGADMETLSLATNPDFLAIIEGSRARWDARNPVHHGPLAIGP